ncbi:MAG: chorismate mutase [Frankiales bacterium]|nr:chorismate mutase [Frankiales bacterium]
MNGKCTTLRESSAATDRRSTDAGSSASDGLHSWDDLTNLRREVDLLDQAMMHALIQRTELSSRIQAVRISLGGPRVDLQRERQIIDTYRHVFGHDGAELASLILRHSRGPLLLSAG